MTVRLHVDLVSNQWGDEYQECVGRVWVDYPSQPEAGRLILGAIPEKYGRGSYFFATDPHADKDCMFEEVGSRLPMVRVAVEGEYRLPALPSEDAPPANT